MINRLTATVDSGRVSHAQRIVGDEREGSLQLALAYLQYLCCTDRRHHEGGDLRADSCGQCPSCRKIASLQHPDLGFVFPSPANGSPSVSADDYQAEFRDFVLATGARGTLDEFNQSLKGSVSTSMIRATDSANIVRRLAMKSYEGGWRMMLIWHAARMNPTAANELLKTLEEPLPGTIILMVDGGDRQLLPTIESRVQTVRLAPRDTAADMPGLAAQYAPMLVDWLRLLFKLKMKELSAQVDKMAALDRQQLAQMLAYAQEVMRECFLHTAAGVPVTIGSGDDRFDSLFPGMITANNIELVCDALNDAQHAIERNAYAKLALMELSFSMSKALKKR